jgi:hypothetical protein
MDATTVLPFPVASSEVLDRDLAEIEAAILMVGQGLATRVRLVGLSDVDAIAGAALARAQDAGVTFGLERSADGATSVVVGPGVLDGR